MADDFALLSRRVKALEANRGCVLRWGEVTGVDEKAGAARVRIDDADGMVSGWLRVRQNRTLKDQHQELPDEGEHVACLFAGQGFEQGIILGAVYSDKDPSPAKDAHVFYRRFKDGTELEYDRETHRMTGNVKGWVALEVERDVDVRVLQKVTITAQDDVLIKSAKTITLEGAVSIILRTPRLFIMGMLGGICDALMTATFRLRGLLDHLGEYAHVGDHNQQGSHTLSGDVTAGGTIMDAGGNTNHHSH